MKPLSRTVRIAVTVTRAGTGYPHHPAEYEVLDPVEIAEVLALWPRQPEHDDFECMCLGNGRLSLYDAGGQLVGSAPPAGPLEPLFDPRDPAGLPARHRARWVAAAPEGLRDYAAGCARGEEPGPPRGVPLSTVFRWLGAVREHPADAAALLAARAPERLLATAKTEELAWAVRETDRTGLDGAVRFFASEPFTTRHPKRRRVADTARDLLLRHARGHRPEDLPVLERRLLRTAEDRVRRS
uniref:PE-PGRS family protein n=1 Tax=Streptomyces sp. NBC_00049 TaxID=2903617 RepID=A0AAU2JY25_9ACTN